MDWKTTLAVLTLSVYMSLASPYSSSFKRLIKDIADRFPAKLDQSELFEPPYLKFVLKPEDATAPEGDTVTLRCEANAIPPPVIRWTFNGVPLKQGRHDGDDNTLEKLLNLGLITIENGVTESKLRLDCVTPNMAGVYACIAENGHELQEADAILDVQESNSAVMCDSTKKSLGGDGWAPIIYLWTNGRFEREGANVQLFCRATGRPEPKIFWTDSYDNPVTSGDRYQVLPNGDLLISRAEYDQMDTYKCVARNKFGEDVVEAFFMPTEREDEMVEAEGRDEESKPEI